MAGRHRRDKGTGQHRSPEPAKSRVHELGRMDKVDLMATLATLDPEQARYAGSMTRDQIIAAILINEG